MALYFNFTTTLPCYMCDDSILYWSKDGTGSYQSDGVTKVYLFFIQYIFMITPCFQRMFILTYHDEPDVSQIFSRSDRLNLANKCFIV